jgi:hypothetical protein
MTKISNDEIVKRALISYCAWINKLNNFDAKSSYVPEQFTTEIRSCTPANNCACILNVSLNDDEDPATDLMIGWDDGITFILQGFDTIFTLMPEEFK